MLPSFIANSGLAVLRRWQNKRFLVANRISFRDGLHSDNISFFFFFFGLLINAQVYSLQGGTGFVGFLSRKQQQNFAYPNATACSSQDSDCFGHSIGSAHPDERFENHPIPVLGDIPFTFEESLSFTRMKVYTLSGLRNQGLRIKQTWIKLVSFWKVKPHKTLILGCMLMKYHDSKDY